MKQKATFWKPGKGTSVQCHLCPHQCTIAEGKCGLCGVRENEQGTLYTLIYGACSAVADDPIEKKPLYHFYPGSRALSLGSIGCNLRCDHCQNYGISRAKPHTYPLRHISPEQAVALAKEYGCQGIAWTYNEPTIWHEYTVDSAKLAKQEGLYTVYVTNGYINEAPLREIAPYLDALNVDVKAFHPEFYTKVCQATLQPVVAACELIKSLGLHLEVTYLVIPTMNDSEKEVTQFCQWVKEKLGEETPVHFSRFHPDYHMKDLPPTPLNTLIKCYEIAQQAGIRFPYLGNIPYNEYENTYCPQCKAILIERYGFSAENKGIEKGKCKQCGTSIPIIGT